MELVSKTKLAEIRKDFEAALAEVAKKHGVADVQLGTIRFDTDGFRVPLTARFEGGESADAKALRMSAKFIGFNDSIVNATISYANRQCKVVGLKRTKLLLEVEGKSMTAPVDQVVRVLKQQKSEHAFMG